jgi:hypothetical protein
MKRIGWDRTRAHGFITNAGPPSKSDETANAPRRASWRCHGSAAVSAAAFPSTARLVSLGALVLKRAAAGTAAVRHPTLRLAKFGTAAIRSYGDRSQRQDAPCAESSPHVECRRGNAVDHKIV